MSEVSFFHTLQQVKQVNKRIGANRSSTINIYHGKSNKINHNTPPHQMESTSGANNTATKSGLEKNDQQIKSSINIII